MIRARMAILKVNDLYSIVTNSRRSLVLYKGVHLTHCTGNSHRDNARTYITMFEKVYPFHIELVYQILAAMPINHPTVSFAYISPPHTEDKSITFIVGSTHRLIINSEILLEEYDVHRLVATHSVALEDPDAVSKAAQLLDGFKYGRKTRKHLRGVWKNTADRL